MKNANQTNPIRWLVTAPALPVRSVFHFHTSRHEWMQPVAMGQCAVQWQPAVTAAKLRACAQ
ncbi:MAG: hypothetical protein PHE53_08865 [Thermoguttaceae bacterium]|nr:hypothetical protein [Thermoguttaceae bacterium]